jgi:DNA-binding NtrC family response regulator
MATILIVDDNMALREGLAETVAGLGHRPLSAASGHEALARLEHEAVDAILLDLRMPDMDGIEVLRRLRENPKRPPVVILTAFASAENTIEAMRLGAFDHLTKPIGRDDLDALLQRMFAPKRVARLADEEGSEGDTLVGSSEAMRHVQKTIGLAADSDATVLVLGETGTGKEMVARALHDHGRRKARPFIAVNCAAIPNDLLESELFGHVKGAFTGAVSDRTGAFREANGGTLLLDEIGDMPPAMQAKILRVLQDQIVMPVGGRPAAVDVRVIAATHRDLTEWIAEGHFREDLYYRINIIRITLPPLRERLADIVPLAEHFLRAASARAPKQLTAPAAARLLSHSWPGNVRELKNVIDRANVLVRGNIIDAGDLDLASDNPATSSPEAAVDWLAGDLPTALARLEEAMIRRALSACGGNRAEAARRLNVHRQLLYAKMQRYGLLHLDVSDAMTAGVVKDDD